MTNESKSLDHYAALVLIKYYLQNFAYSNEVFDAVNETRISRICTSKEQLMKVGNRDYNH